MNAIKSLKETPQPHPAQPARWRWWGHLVILGSFPLVVGAVALLGKGRPQAPLSGSVRGLLITTVSELGIFGAIFLAAWLFSRASREDLLMKKPFRWIMVPWGLAYSIGLRLGIGLVAAVATAALVFVGVASFEQVRHFMGTNGPDTRALVDVNALRNNPLYLILHATLISFVVAAFREELWRAGVLAALRALWPGRFAGTKGELLGVAIAAVIFGLGHFAQGPLGVFFTGFLGLLLGCIMVYHRSIWPAVIAHGFFDATSFVVLPWLLK